MNTSSLVDVLHVGVYMNYCMYYLYVLNDLGEVRYRNLYIMPLSSGDFHENGLYKPCFSKGFCVVLSSLDKMQ
jgi:hypothetical protein